MDEKEFEGLSIDGAKEKIAEVRSDPKHPYFNNSDFRHKDAAARMNRLHEIAFPEPEGLPSDPDARALGKKLKEAGVTAEEIEEAARKREEGEEYAEKDPEAKQYRATTEAELKREWGDEYEEHLQDAQFAVEMLGEKEGLGPDFIKTLEKDLGEGRRLGNDPQTIRVLSRLGALAKQEMAKQEEEGGEKE